jgi:hypothetical protein
MSISMFMLGENQSMVVKICPKVWTRGTSVSTRKIDGSVTRYIETTT